MFKAGAAGGSVALIIIIFCIAFAMEGFSLRRLTIKNVSFIGVMSGTIVLMTFIIGYSRILFFQQIAIGASLIFITGMAIGPFSGCITAVVSDILGNVINPSGPYFPAYTVASTMYSLLGALVFAWRSEKHGRWRMYGFMVIGVAIEVFGASPVAARAMMGANYGYLVGINNTIVFFIQIAIFIAITPYGFSLLWRLVLDKPDRYKTIWVGRTGQVDLKLKKNRSLNPDYDNLMRAHKLEKSQKFVNN